jgi:hypothetical protein
MPHKDPEARKEYLRQWREQNLETIKAKQIAYVARKKEHRAAVNKARYERKKSDIQAKQAEYRDKNRERLTEYAAKHREENRELLRAKAKARYAERKSADAKANILRGARSRAKETGIPFDLTVESLTWPTHCPVFGVQLTYNGHQAKRDTRASLDRKDPNLGYTKENVRVISMRANRIKSDATQDELEAIIKYMRGP